jgi:hypothetical protein
LEKPLSPPPPVSGRAAHARRRARARLQVMARSGTAGAPRIRAARAVAELNKARRGGARRCGRVIGA